MGKFPRKVMGFTCDECGDELITGEDEEEHLREHAGEITHEVEGWQCVVCDEVYEDKDEAYNCCG